MTRSGFKTAQAHRNAEKKHTSHVNRKNLNQCINEDVFFPEKVKQFSDSFARIKNTKRKLTLERNAQLVYKFNL